MKVHRFFKGITVAALIVCFGVAAAVAADTGDAQEAVSVDVVLAGLSEAIAASDLADDVRERLAGYVANVAELVGEEKTAEALLAAVIAALESAEGEYAAFLTGVKAALEVGAFDAGFAAHVVALAAEGVLQTADAEVWSELLTPAAGE